MDNNFKHKHKLKKINQLLLSQESNTKIRNPDEEFVDKIKCNQKTQNEMESYNNEILKSKREKKRIKKTKDNSENSLETIINNGKIPTQHIKRKHKCYYKNKLKNETNNNITNILNEQTIGDLKSSILPASNIISNFKNLSLNDNANKLIKTLGTYYKWPKEENHRDDVQKNRNYVINDNINTSKNGKAVLQHLDVNSCNARVHHNFQNKKLMIVKHERKCSKPIPNYGKNQNATEYLTVKHKRKKNKRIKHYTINKIRWANSYRNISGIKRKCNEPILMYEDDIYIKEPKASTKLKQIHPVSSPMHENNEVKNKNYKSKYGNKLSKKHRDVLEENKGVLGVSHLNDATNLDRSNSFINHSRKVDQKKNCCRLDQIKEPNPQEQISEPAKQLSLNEHGKRLQLQLMKSFSRQQLKRNKKRIKCRNKYTDEKNVHKFGRIDYPLNTFHEDHLMFIYANRESSSKESLKIAIRRDSDVSKNGCSNMFNVVIKQTKGSTSKIGIPQSTNEDNKDINPFKCIIQEHSNYAHLEKPMKESACQTESLNLKEESTMGKNDCTSSVTNHSATEKKFLVKMPILNTHNKKGLCAYNEKLSTQTLNNETCLNSKITRTSYLYGSSTSNTNPSTPEKGFIVKIPFINSPNQNSTCQYNDSNVQKPEMLTSGTDSPQQFNNETFSKNKMTKTNEFFTVLADSELGSTATIIPNSKAWNVYQKNNYPILRENKELESKLNRIGINDKSGFIQILDNQINNKSGSYDLDNVIDEQKTQQLSHLSELDSKSNKKKDEVNKQDAFKNAMNENNFSYCRKINNMKLANVIEHAMEHDITNKGKFLVVLPPESVSKNEDNQRDRAKIVRYASDFSIKTNLSPNFFYRAPCIKDERFNLPQINDRINLGQKTIQELPKENCLGNTTIKDHKLDSLFHNSSDVYGCGTCNNLAVEDLTVHQTPSCEPAIIPIVSAVQNYLQGIIQNTLFISSIRNCSGHNIAKFNNALNGLLENCIEVLTNIKTKEGKTKQLSSTSSLINLFDSRRFINVLKDTKLELEMQCQETKDDEYLQNTNSISEQKHSLETNKKPFFVIIPSTEGKKNMEKANSAQNNKGKDQKRSLSLLNITKDNSLAYRKTSTPSENNKVIDRQDNIKKLLIKDSNLKNVNFKNAQKILINEKEVRSLVGLNNNNNKSSVKPSSHKGEKLQLCRNRFKRAIKSKSIHSVYSHVYDSNRYQQIDIPKHFIKSFLPTDHDCSYQLRFGDTTCNKKVTAEYHLENTETVKYNNNVEPVKNYFKFKPNYNAIGRNGNNKTCTVENLNTSLKDTMKTGPLIENRNFSSNHSIWFCGEKYKRAMNVENNHDTLPKYTVTSTEKEDYLKCNEGNSDIINKNNSSIRVQNDLSNKLEAQPTFQNENNSLIISKSAELLDDLENSLTFDDLASKVNVWKTKCNLSKLTQSRIQLKNTIFLNAGNNVQSAGHSIESDTDPSNGDVSLYLNQQNYKSKDENYPVSCNKIEKENKKTIFTLKDVESESSVISSFSIPKNSMLFTNSGKLPQKSDSLMKTPCDSHHDEDINNNVCNIKYPTGQYSGSSSNQWISLSNCTLQNVNNPHVLCETQSMKNSEGNNLRLQMDVKMDDVMHVEFCCRSPIIPKLKKY